MQDRLEEMTRERDKMTEQAEWNQIKLQEKDQLIQKFQFPSQRVSRHNESITVPTISPRVVHNSASPLKNYLQSNRNDYLLSNRNEFDQRQKIAKGEIIFDPRSR